MTRADVNTYSFQNKCTILFLSKLCYHLITGHQLSVNVNIKTTTLVLAQNSNFPLFVFTILENSRGVFQGMRELQV